MMMRTMMKQPEPPAENVQAHPTAPVTALPAKKEEDRGSSGAATCSGCNGTKQIQTTEWPALYDICPDCQNA